MENTYGYAEMMEWKDWTKDKTNKFGYFVSLENGQIVIGGKNPIGVTSCNYSHLSGNLNHFERSLKMNEVGDIYVEKKTIGKGVRRMICDMPYIDVTENEEYVPAKNEDIIDKTKEFVPRLNRPEWVPVVITGRVIVYDNGKVDTWKVDVNEDGTVCNGSTYNVLRRFSNNTIEILLK